MPRPTPEQSFRARILGYQKRANLRPLESGEIIDSALKIFQANVWPFLKANAIPMVFCQAGLTFIFEIAVPGIMKTSSPGDLAVESSEIVFSLAIALLVALPMMCYGFAKTLGTAAYATAESLHGSQIDFATAEARSAKIVWPVIVAVYRALLPGGIVFAISGLLSLFTILASNAKDDTASVGFGALNVVTFLVGLGFVPFALRTLALAPTIVAIEGLDPKSALKKSKYLAKMRSGHGSGTSVLFSTVIVLFFVGLALVLSLEFLVNLTGLSSMIESVRVFPGSSQLLQTVVASIPTYLAIWLLSPLWSILATVLYYDRIVRLEAYDVKVMIDDIANAERRAILLR